MKVLVTGGLGMLGSDTANTLDVHGMDALPVDIEEADITQKDAVDKLISSCGPDFIVHCAAYTLVDDCETNRDLAFKVNGEGTRNIAGAAKNANIPIIYISTDYVFDGTSSTPWTEKDAVDPINAYGESKLAGEKSVQEICENYYIVRTSWLYGKRGANFVDTMRKIMEKGTSPVKVVNDQEGSPTYSLHLAEAIAGMVGKVAGDESPPPGIYHVTGGGSCTWYEFAKKIAEILGFNVEIAPVSTGEFPRDAKRPRYSVLDNSLLYEVFGIKMPHWEAAVKEYLEPERPQ